MIHAGRLEKEWGAVYTRLFEDRLRGDYRDDVNFEPEEARALVEGAAGFVARIRRLLEAEQDHRPGQ